MHKFLILSFALLSFGTGLRAADFPAKCVPSIKKLAKTEAYWAEVFKKASATNDLVLGRLAAAHLLRDNLDFTFFDRRRIDWFIRSLEFSAVSKGYDKYGRKVVGDIRPKLFRKGFQTTILSPVVWAMGPWMLRLAYLQMLGRLERPILQRLSSDKSVTSLVEIFLRNFPGEDPRFFLTVLSSFHESNLSLASHMKARIQWNTAIFGVFLAPFVWSSVNQGVEFLTDKDGYRSTALVLDLAMDKVADPTGKKVVVIADRGIWQSNPFFADATASVVGLDPVAYQKEFQTIKNLASEFQVIYVSNIAEMQKALEETSQYQVTYLFAHGLNGDIAVRNDNLKTHHSELRQIQRPPGSAIVGMACQFGDSYLCLNGHFDKGFETAAEKWIGDQDIRFVSSVNNVTFKASYDPNMQIPLPSVGGVFKRYAALHLSVGLGLMQKSVLDSGFKEITSPYPSTPAYRVYDGNSGKTTYHPSQVAKILREESPLIENYVIRSLAKDPEMQGVYRAKERITERMLELVPVLYFDNVAYEHKSSKSPRFSLGNADEGIRAYLREEADKIDENSAP